jgi:hypothetical protein
VSAAASFGRVDSENNVYVTDSGVERRVGQYPNVSAEEALAYFVRKFDDLEFQVRNLEQRVKNKVDSQSLKPAISKLTKELESPNAVGDLASLRARIQGLLPQIEVLDQSRQEATKESQAQALSAREAIAVEAERIANQDAAKINWKASSAEFAKLFEQWQELQKNGVKVNRGESDVIWKRFSSARTRFEAGKRAYFATLDASNKQARARKNAIVEEAEKLVDKGAAAVVEYRKLIDEWKAAGRTPGKSDDALWLRLKAAGDAIYAAKSEQMAVENVEFEANLKTKLALLDEAKAIDPEKDLAKAKELLRDISARWEKAGKVPRDKVREIEDKLRAVENRVKAVEAEQWRKSDPAVIARNESVATQIKDSIAKLEAELEAAKTSKDAKKIADAQAALEARKAWLAVVSAS